MRLWLSWRWMLPILLLSTYLGTSLLTYDALWFDEWITLFISGTGNFTGSQVQGTICEGLGSNFHTPLHTLCIAAIDNSWPPLYFFMQEAWDLLSGGNYFIDRCLALFMGLLAISVLYRLGKNLLDEKSALAAALLLGTSIFFTFYMHEIRGYTLYVLMSALCAWLYWRLLLNHRAKRGLRWAFALSIAGILYTHYIGIAVVFGIGLYHLLFERKTLKNRVHWWNILKLYLNGCLAYGVWVAVLYISFVNESLNPRDIPTIQLLEGMMRGFSNNLTPLALILIALSLLRWKERPIRFLWTWGLSILGVAIVGNLAADFLFHPRHIMGLMPAFVLVIVVGINYLSEKLHPLAWLIVPLWVGLGIFYGQNTDFMNAIPQHVDAIPLPAMTTIVHTAEQCGTSDSTFILGTNSPDEEWVQDLPLDYYLGGFPSRFISLSRIMSDEWVEKQGSPLLPDELEIAGVQARYDYFTEGQALIFLFSLPQQALEAELTALQSLLANDDFIECPNLVSRDDLRGTAYVRDAAQCSQILTNCSGNN